MSETQDLLLRVKDLKTYFHLYEGVVRAVDGVSFDLRKGRTLGVIGESGCGKSVTAQSVLRLVPEPPGKIESGQILYYRQNTNGGSAEEIDIAALKPTGQQMRSIRWKEISVIFQEPMTSLSPVHTIGDQIVEAILLHYPEVKKKEAIERTTSLLKQVGIPDADRFVDAYSYQFSGGMRQRAMIAMALSCHPQLLIADEPTTALDVTVEAQIVALIKDLQKQYNMAMLYISHDLAVIGEVSDEVMVMYLGVVVEHAPVASIFENPLHPYTQALWRSIPRVELQLAAPGPDGKKARLQPIAGSLPNPYLVHHGCRFFGRCDRSIPGVCDAAPPPLVEVKPGHKVRCVHYLQGGSHD